MELLAKENVAVMEEKDAFTIYQNLSSHDYFLLSGSSLRSNMPPTWLVENELKACGKLEDTEKAKLLFTSNNGNCSPQSTISTSQGMSAGSSDIDRIMDPADIEQRALWPEIRTFNTLLTGVCVMDEYLTGVGLMGIIERMFAEISAWIGSGIVEHRWLTEERLIHYTLHAEIDIKHSQDFFDILQHSWDKSLEDQYAIEQGLLLGAYVFNRLYEDLYRARTRRVFRKTLGMHSRAEG